MFVNDLKLMMEANNDDGPPPIRRKTILKNETPELVSTVASNGTEICFFIHSSNIMYTFMCNCLLLIYNSFVLIANFQCLRVYICI